MKKWLVCLIVLFSAIIPLKINAATSYTTIQEYDFEDFSLTYNNITYDKEIIYSKIEKYLTENTEYTMSDYSYIFIGVPTEKSTSTGNTLGFIYVDLFSEDFIDNTSFTSRGTAWGYWQVGYLANNSIHLSIPFNGSDVRLESNSSMYIYSMVSGNSTSKNFSVYTNFNINSSMIVNNSSYSDYMKIYVDNSMMGEKTYNVTFHLNGGKVYDSNVITDEMGSYIVGYQYDDYTSLVNANELYNYLINQEVTKETMQFVGWYYDEKLTQKVEADDVLDSDKHFYAKYQYKNVEDFLNNTNFNSYTFDTNYQYAVISLNNQTNRDIYLGLGIISHNLEIYKYLKETNTTLNGSSFCLSPIFYKESIYYYHLDSPLNSEYEVLIIPKEKLNGNYDFLVSDNAYVTYTNDLKSLTIKDDAGNDLIIDIEDSYNYSQDALLNNENDLLEIFKDLINNRDNNVFSYFNQVWNYMKQNKLFIYFMTLIIGSLIILIIKAASR